MGRNARHLQLIPQWIDLSVPEFGILRLEPTAFASCPAHS